MQKISYNEPYGMQKAVFEGYKLMTRREPIFEEIKEPRTEFDTKGHLCLYDGDRLVHVSRYAVGEEVAIAQRYCDIANDPYFKNQCAADELSVKCDIATSAGWSNKMFVKAWLMPRRQIITDIKAERLQDISWKDIVKEGIFRWAGSYLYHWNRHAEHPEASRYHTYQEAFAALFDRISGKGTWERNPYVFVYSFKLVK